MKHDFSTHDKREDPYAWMRDPNWEKVIDGEAPLEEKTRLHIEAENAKTDAYMSGAKGLQDQITQEIIGRIKEDNLSVPELSDDGFYYYTRMEKGRDYPVYCRNKTGEAKENSETYFDVNKWVNENGFSFYKHAVSISPDGKLAAILEDTNGSETFSIRIMDMSTAKTVESLDVANEGNITWTNDSQNILYGRRNLELKRTDAILQHKIGTSVENDTTVFENPYLNEGWHIGMGKMNSKRFIQIRVSEQGTNEVYLLDQENGLSSPQLVAQAETGIEYSVSHDGKGHLYVLTNHSGANDFKIAKTSVEDIFDNKGSSAWVDDVPNKPGRFISSIDMQKGRLIYTASDNEKDQQDRIFTKDLETKKIAEIPVTGMGDVYDVSGYATGPFDSSTVRVQAASFKHPGRVFDYNANTRASETRKEISFESHDPDDYIVERIMIEARDGEMVPVSIMRHKDTPLDGSAALLQYGYGSYGITIDAGFSPMVPSYVDRGMIYAVAHIRGGSEKGHDWYLAGKLEHKQNTFNDFIDVTEALIEKGYTSPKKVVAQGASAGGMLMGVVANERPDIYQSILAGVPFVDVLNTICDASLPLTPGEWNEWGNPIEDPKAYALLESYSPYDNITDQAYPDMLIESSLTDYRVTYWEPAKWQARLKDHNTGDSNIMLKIEMEGGHGGKSGRYDRFRERAFSMAFAIKSLGLEKVS